MINQDLYSAVAAAYEDDDIQCPVILLTQPTPLETVENAKEYHEYAKRQFATAQLKVAYQYGLAVHQELMNNPGASYRGTGASLGLGRNETVWGTRTYLLFRDHSYSLEKFRFSLNTLKEMMAATFDRTRIRLTEHYPPAAFVDYDELI